MKRIWSFLWLFIIVVMDMHAQIFNLLDEDLYQCRIKLVSEFFDRFNGKEIHHSLRAKSLDYKKNNLLLLFDLSQFTSKKDSLFLKADSLAQIILKDSIQLNYNDTTWLAKAQCHGKLCGKDVDFTLYLNVEGREKDMYKWVIAKADGEIFGLNAENKYSGLILMPDDHETNFMSLHRITYENPEEIVSYTRKKFHPDKTSVFLTLVKMNLLKIEYVNHLTFILFQVPGYQLEISHIERESINAGWLITSFVKMTNKEKEKFLKSIYHSDFNLE